MFNCVSVKPFIKYIPLTIKNISTAKLALQHYHMTFNANNLAQQEILQPVKTISTNRKNNKIT